jgi:tRNA-dihydrouridine synthase A
VDKNDSYEDLRTFVTTVVGAAGPRAHFVVHARVAILKGLSAHENRVIPPLQYPLVHRLKAEFPGLQISINGGIVTWEQVQENKRIPYFYHVV